MGYNSRLWQKAGDAIVAMQELGYHRENPEAMIATFQGDWNWVSQGTAVIPPLRELDWDCPVIGNLVVDGELGPFTLNALECALINQRNGIPWPALVEIGKDPARGFRTYYGRRFEDR